MVWVWIGEGRYEGGGGAASALDAGPHVYTSGVVSFNLTS